VGLPLAIEDLLSFVDFVGVLEVGVGVVEVDEVVVEVEEAELVELAELGFDVKEADEISVAGADEAGLD